MVRYKVIWKEGHKRRGENYDRKTHTKAEAEELKNQAQAFNKKYKAGASVKVVRVRPVQRGNGFGMPMMRIRVPRF